MGAWRAGDGVLPMASHEDPCPGEPLSDPAESRLRLHTDWTPGPLEALGDEPWLVLGGGGLKGLAHVGAWQALEEAAVVPSGIIGTSIGALVGACLAGGMRWRELVPLAFALRRSDIARINRRVLLLNGIRQESLLLGEPLRDYIRRVLPVTEWSELEIPLQINAVDLETGMTVWFGTGADTSVSLVDAVYASAALPVFYPPAEVGDKVYVDGGTEFSLPLVRAADLGATGIVAVDPGSGRQSHPHRVVAQGMLAVHQRVFSIMSWRKRTDMVAHWETPPLLYVRPDMEGIGTFDFDKVRYFLEEGYRATREALLRGV